MFAGAAAASQSGLIWSGRPSQDGVKVWITHMALLISAGAPCICSRLARLDLHAPMGTVR